MKFVQALHLQAILLVGILASAGCGEPATAIGKNTEPATDSPAKLDAAEKGKAAPKARVSDRPENLQGKVLVLEYHHISKTEARWDRSVERFKGDLERLYHLGFRPVLASEYLAGKMDLPPGASPVVMTFDDAGPSQIRLLADGSVDPECAVGIWQAFAEKHPDFPVKGTFYVLPVMWGQPQLVERKIEMLKSLGSELGSHTLTHGKLSQMSEKKVKEELAGAIDMLAKWGFENVSIALPFGISPKDRSLLQRFEHNGKTYAMSGAMLVGAGPAPSPNDPKFDPFRVPRIQAIEGDFGITYWLDKVEKGDVAVFVAP